MSVLVLSGIKFAYSGSNRKVLDGVDLSIEKGEAVLISGPSGGGKTTLCLVAATIIPTRVQGDFSGMAELMGQGTRKLGPSGASEYVGYVMQEPEFSMIMPTVEDEIAFGLENRGREPAEVAVAVEGVMTRLGMDGLAGRDPRRLSSGEKQLVAMASAVVHKPQLVILDEALSGLDDDKRALALAELDTMRQGGAALLIAEHAGTGRQAPFLSARRYVLQDGRLAEEVSG